MKSNSEKCARYVRENVGAPSSILADIFTGSSCPNLNEWAGIMLPELLGDVSLFRVLHQIDRDLAEQCRQDGCPFCQGPLHYSTYFRKPRGGPEDIPEAYTKRLSLCCGRKECRRRVLPLSCLFLGRKVYWQAIILAAMTLRQKRPNGFAINQLMRMLSISRTTIVRWIQYFGAVFPTTAHWQRIRGRVSAMVSDQGLPGNLVEHFLAHSSEPLTGLVDCLRFLAWGQAR